MGKKGHYPVQKLQELRTVGNDANKLIDVPKILSMTNHRLYRQNKVYKTKINLLNKTAVNQTHPNGFTIEVFALRDTWMLKNAYSLAKKTYEKHTKEERARLGKSQIARWEDFRITTDLNGAFTEMRPYIVSSINLASVQLNTGEFNNSVVFDEAGVAKAFSLFDTPTRFNIIEEYDHTANTDTDPENRVTSSLIPYGSIDNDAQGDQFEFLQESANEPPYDKDSLEPDYPFVKIGEIGFKGANGFLVSTTGYFEAPLGIIYLRFEDADGEEAGSADFKLQLECASGTYKGVHAEEYA